MHKWITAATVTILLASAAQAQEKLNGTWEGETKSGTSIVLTLAVKDTALTGTLVRAGQSASLSNGKVSKNTFTFTATINDQTEGFSGVLAGDEIRIWLDRQGPSSAIVLRRARQK